jgi:long-chain acyl-CoA synthetase
MSHQNPKTFNELLYENEKKYVDLVYLRQAEHGTWREITWKDAMLQARKMTALLKEIGLQKGDKVAIFSKNCAEWLIADFAIAMGGFTSVPLYATQAKDSISYVLDHSDTKAIFVGKIDNWQAVNSAIPEKLIRIAFPYDNPMPAQFQWNDVLAKTEPFMENHIPAYDDIYTLVYTSGTTGNPKGAIISFGAQSHLKKTIETMGAYNLLDHNYYFSYLPLGHIAERAGIEYPSLLAKSTVAFSDTLSTFAKDLRETSPTFFFGVPRIWAQFQKAILANIPQDQLDKMMNDPTTGESFKKQMRQNLGLDRAHTIWTGAAPISKDLLEWFHSLGVELKEIYGRTEDITIISRPQPNEYKVGSVGKAIAGVELKIDQNGQLLSRSRMIMSGYYKNPEATKAAFTDDGFLITGDLAKIDSEGYLHILGRASDPFKTDKGEFVNPVAIEGKFGRNAYIEQMCLIGMTLHQPVLLVVLSEAAKQLPRDEVSKSLKATLEEINPGLTKYECVSNLVILKDTWTPDNERLTPTLKTKRMTLHQSFIELARQASAGSEAIVWE